MNNIHWVPLDLPSIPKEITLENVIQLFDYIPNVSDEERKVLAEQRQHYKYAWNTFRLRYPADQKTDWSGQNLNNEWSWTDSAKTNCPQLISYIETHLPFKKIKAASVMSSTGSVPLHLDMSLNASEEEKINYTTHEPSIYRLLLDGSIHENSFYVASKSLGKKYVKLPIDSPGWAMGCYSCGHGNDEPIPHQKILLYIMGDLDTIKHQELINRSYSKYKEFAIVSKEQI